MKQEIYGQCGGRGSPCSNMATRAVKVPHLGYVLYLCDSCYALEMRQAGAMLGSTGEESRHGYRQRAAQ